MHDTIILSRGTVQQVLEALEYASTGNRRPEIIGPAVTALKAALGYWDIGEDNPDSLSKHPAFRRAPQQQAEPECEHCYGSGKTIVYGMVESWEENCLYCNGTGITQKAST